MRWTQEQKEGFANILYFLQKNYCNHASFSELLESSGLSEKDWEDIKIQFFISYGIKFYV